ncbi:MAG: hypothetical protein DRI90_09025 [Deltaproteobacteria bacterium]|nr:MAG: hypothetical protein DRI90_09025 [Deltaproteobacteria bacterium]
MSSHSDASRTYRILVFRENAIGSAATAQPYIDKLVAMMAKANQWSAAEGKYVTRRPRAQRYIEEKKPEFGILSLGPFLAMRTKHGLEVVGTAEVARAGGRQYHLISKTAADLSGCRGQKVASNHAGDKRFIEKVVAGGSFTLADFDLMKTRRPVQTIKKVIRGDAVCALIDDAQLAELPHISGTAGIRSVWKSAKLPPIAVVAFSGSSAPERAKFKAALGSLCTGPGKSYCDKVGIQALKPADQSTYSAVITAYDK